MAEGGGRSGRKTAAGLAALAVCGLALAAPPAAACEVALLLAIDVSNSIDETEYQLQTEGLARALRDPEVGDALVAGEVALSVVQWSGRGDQAVSLPWRRMTGPRDVAAMAAEAARLPRAFVMSDTAVGDLLRFALGRFGGVADCARRVVDISGDGTDNAGTEPEAARRQVERAGITVNALAIEGIGLPITSFYRQRVVTRNGFVVTARGHRSYAETLRRKLLREVTRPMF